MKTLLHTCCGPCASACVPRLKEMGREVTMLFANSNIDTHEEFEKRFAEAQKLAVADGVTIVALPYDHDEWLKEVAHGYESEPEKGARCARCFRYNLKKTAEYAAANGFDEFTTSLTVSPHKVSKMIFEAGREAVGASRSDATRASRPLCTATNCEGDTDRDGGALASAERKSASFLPEDFKKREGFKLSVRRAIELGLYRQSYCGCEFSKPPTLNPQPPTFNWIIHHKTETASTNLDARAGAHGDVFTADFQTAGRGRLDHKWLSPPGTNLMMSAVLSVEGLAPDHVATLPLVVGLAVIQGISAINPQPSTFNFQPSTLNIALKWPNDVLISGRKVAGILCERVDDRIVVGIGVNVKKQEFSPEIADKAISLGSVPGFALGSVTDSEGAIPLVRDAILRAMDGLYAQWREAGFASVYPKIAAVDFLRGQTLIVRQTDDDTAPIRGVCGGILPNGALDVGGVKVYAGEAHVERMSRK